MIEEIRLLRKNLLNVKNLTVETPTAGGSIDSAYELVMYMALARNILTKIEKCKHNKFGRTYLCDIGANDVLQSGPTAFCPELPAATRSGAGNSYEKYHG